MRLLAAVGALLVAGCGEGGGSDVTMPDIPKLDPPSTYAFDVFVDNYDASPYSAWVEWQETGTGTWKAYHLFQLPSAPSGSHSSQAAIYHVTPGRLYYLVIANDTGSVLVDSMELGSITTATYFPVLTSFTVKASRLAKTF